MTFVTSAQVASDVQWRFRHRNVVIWVLAVAATLAATAIGVARLYDTPTEIQEYADSVSSGALYAINGKFEGINTLGGVIQDEFGFLASFLLPLMGLAMMAGPTRGEEEAGRLELLLARPVDRRAPVVGAFVVTTAALVAVTVLMGLAMGAAGVPFWRGMLYAASLGALAYCFAGIAAVAAQLVRHARGVYTVGFAVLVAAYVLRGVGDTIDLWVVWLSPLGWAEKVDAFGPARTWALAIPLVVGTAGIVTAAALAGRRDVGDSTLQYGIGGPSEASSWLRRPIGTAAWIHRGSLLGWMAGALAFVGMFGALAQQVVDAIVENAQLADALNTSTENPADGFFAITLVYLALIAIGYVAAAFAVLRRQETDGHLEPILAGSVSRIRWLATQYLVIGVGLLAILAAGTITLALTAAASLGESGVIGDLIVAGLAYVPAVAFVAGIAAALFGLRPQLFPLVWAVVGVIAFIAFLGPGLELPMLVRNLSPTQHVGNPPDGDVEIWGLVIMSTLALVLGAIGIAGLRDRDVPQP
ncbi:MAG: hypothetical protein S0880_26510 [Actinomycetota bacterium]|nr:hypothetical protein [Actinomycetota bacterium]